MTIELRQPPVLRLFGYTVASADMFYAEQEQRDILLGKDDHGHVRIWGATTNGGPSTRIGLCRVFLEYAMYLSTWCPPAEAGFHMQTFGERLGHDLAYYLQDNPDLLAPHDPTVRALEQVFQSVGADFSEEYLESGVRFLVSHCPVEEAAKRAGLTHVELARHGINALCRILILDLDPSLTVYTAPDNLAEFMFTFSTPAPA